jgi:uncharacterized protein (TIGR03435 family)
MKPVFLGAALVCLASAIGQPKFDSGAITPNHSGNRMMSMHVQFLPEPVELTMNNVTLKFCLQQAYGLSAHQVFGPAWINSTRYDVKAALPPAGDREQVWPAFQALLDEHFKLALRHETKMMPVYQLTVARGGAKLTPSSDRHEKAIDAAPDENASARMNHQHITMKEFCNALSRRLDRVVLDATGLTGAYDIVLNYEHSRDESGLSIFTALQRQIGLKLEPRNAPVDIVIVKSPQRVHHP